MSAMPKLNNRYELREIIGEGGMGIVYRASLNSWNTRISSIFTMPESAKRTEKRSRSLSCRFFPASLWTS